MEVIKKRATDLMRDGGIPWACALVRYLGLVRFPWRVVDGEDLVSAEIKH